MNNQTSFFSTLPVTCHTDYVGKGSIFVAINGTKLNGNDFIIQAIKKGATKIVIHQDSILSQEVVDSIKLNKIEIEKVQDCRLALTQLSAQAWNYPNKKLKIIGITGTKGKTTSVFILHHLLTQAGYKTAMLSGVFNKINQSKYNSSLTTPLPDYLYAFLNECVQQGVEYVVMEASAQAFSLKRLFGLEFSGAIFTNLDLEHMEFYSDMNQYFLAKSEIFKSLKKDAHAIVNIDDQWGNKIADQNKVHTLSLNKKSDFSIQIKENNIHGLKLILIHKEEEFNFESNLIGIFNAYNICAVISLCLMMGISFQTITDGLKTFKFVPGRMEIYPLKNGALAVVDHAHNPSSFYSVFSTLKSLSKKLIVVFGAGGDRDKQKRPLMGSIATSIADNVIITSDNPRSEDVNDIISQIIVGISDQNLKKVVCDIDRKIAIKKAYDLSSKGDIIAIVGKGIEEYQIIGDNKEFFSDKETILQFRS